ncbi:unnamed protein product [Rotaria sp. Silwood2]|nr:unnamed protein product [Rotaria sp. Silwood2]
MNYSDALTHCQQSLEKFHETKNSIVLAETYYLMGNIFQNQTNNDMAIECYEKSLVYQKNIYSDSHPIRIRTCDSLGEVYFLTGKYQLALNHFLEVLKNKQSNQNDEDLCILHGSLACCYHILNQYDFALEHANLSLTISETSLNIKDIEVSYILLGEIFDEQRKFNLSVEYYEKLMIKSIEYNNYEMMKTACSKYISSITYLINEENEENFEKNIKILSNFYEKYVFLNDVLVYDDLHRIIINISVIYLKTKKFSLGIQQFKYMLKDIEIKANNYDKQKITIFLFTRIAWLYEKDEKYDLAVNQYQLTLKNFQTFDNNNNLTDFVIETFIECYECIGRLYHQLKEYNLAIENQIEGLFFIKRLNKNQYEQEIFNFNYTIANCYIELEKYDLALIYYTKCVEIEKQCSVDVDDSDASIYMYEIVADSYYKNHQYDLAIDCYEKGLHILQLDNDQQSSIETAQFHYKIGCCYKMQKDSDLFIHHFQIALKILEDDQSNDNKQQLIDIYFELGWCYQQSKKYDLAIEYFQKMLLRVYQKF